MTDLVILEYKRIKHLFENSPKKNEIINFWKERDVDISTYIDFQFLNQKNVLPESILSPTEDEIIKIKLNEFFYFVPMKDISHMGDGNREPWLIEALSDVKEGDLFVDVGANLGLFTVSIGKKTKVIAFEPEDENYELLNKNVQINQVQDNVTIIKKIVSDKKSKTKLFTSRFGSFSSIVNPEKLGWKEKKSKDIETVTLDDVLKENNIDKVDWMKIDVEGAELLVLNGAEKSISEGKIKNILIEIHAIMINDATPEKLYELLSNYYNIKVLWRDKNNPAYHYIHASLK